MGFRAERYGSRADTAILAACLVLALTALALPEQVRAPVAGAFRSVVLYPLLSLQHGSAEVVASRASFSRLRAERDSLGLTAMLQPELLDENARLRGLLGLGGRLGGGYTAAEVLHQSGLSDGLTLLLSAGTADGVEVLAPVVSAAGLVGLVLSADAHTSVALAWTHPDFRAGAMAGARAVFGIAAARRGEQPGEVMELRGVAYRNALTPGTEVVTSGLGGVYPQGVPLGTVRGVLAEDAGWERTYLLQPAVHPSNVTHVLILSRARASQSLRAAFADSTAATPDKVPVRIPTAAPVRIPTAAPVRAPDTAPVRAPTAAPVRTPDTAPASTPDTTLPLTPRP